MKQIISNDLIIIKMINYIDINYVKKLNKRLLIVILSPNHVISDKLVSRCSITIKRNKSK